MVKSQYLKPENSNSDALRMLFSSNPNFYRSVFVAQHSGSALSRYSLALIQPFASLGIDNSPEPLRLTIARLCFLRSRLISSRSLESRGSSSSLRVVASRFMRRRRPCRHNHLEHAHAPRVHRTAIISGFNVQLSVTCRLSSVG